VPQPNAYSNRPRAGVPTRVTAILFDELNTSPEEHVSARHHLLQYLGQLDPDGRVGLYVIGSRLHVVRDFTGEPRGLADAFRRQPTDFSVMDIDWEAVFPEPEGMGAGGANAGAGLHAATRRVGATLQAFRHIVRHLRAVPGRKNLIWISGGFPLSIGYDDFSARDGPLASFKDEAKETKRALEDANVAIYPVLTAGLRGMLAFSALQSDPGIAAGIAEGKIERAKTAMRLLAEQTGGRAYYDTNGIATAIADAAQDGRYAYTLGFRPDHDRWDGRFRSIRVRVDRRGVRVRTRRGYHALPEPAPTERDSGEALRSEAANPWPSAGVGLTIRLTEPPDVSGVIRFVMAVDPRDLSLETRGSRRVGALDVLWILQPAGRAQTRVVRDGIALDLTAESYARALADGLTVTKDLACADVAGGLRVVVRDAHSGASGSLTVPTAAMPSAPATPP
jgi:VWFA-related protein